MFMDTIKTWNMKISAYPTYANLKTHMRKEYLDLQEVGGITINNSSLSQANMIQELKVHQEAIPNNMKEELKANLMQTLQTFSLT